MLRWMLATGKESRQCETVRELGNLQNCQQQQNESSKVTSPASGPPSPPCPGPNVLIFVVVVMWTLVEKSQSARKTVVRVSIYYHCIAQLVITHWASPLRATVSLEWVLPHISATTCDLLQSCTHIFASFTLKHWSIPLPSSAVESSPHPIYCPLRNLY